MPRIVVIGNAAGGKSTLARHLAQRKALPLIELDKLLWQEGWRFAPADTYARKHAEIISRDGWVIEGLGSQASIPERVARATQIVLIDMPLWMHFALAAERQVKWKEQEAPPAGSTEMPPTRELFKTMWEVDQSWLPAIRDLCGDAELAGKSVTQLFSLKDIEVFMTSVR